MTFWNPKLLLNYGATFYFIFLKTKGVYWIRTFDDIYCKTRENSNFLKKGKIVISVKIRNFSRSWMTKRTSPLKSSPGI